MLKCVLNEFIELQNKYDQREKQCSMNQSTNCWQATNSDDGIKCTIDLSHCSESQGSATDSQFFLAALLNIFENRLLIVTYGSLYRVEVCFLYNSTSIV